MFGRLKNEAHVQPVAGCYSNEIHHNEARKTLQNVTTPVVEDTHVMLKNYWLFSFENARQQPIAPPETVKQQADKLLALTKMRALSRIGLKKTNAA